MADHLDDPDGTIMDKIAEHCALGMNQIVVAGFTKVSVVISIVRWHRSLQIIVPNLCKDLQIYVEGGAWDTLLQIQEKLESLDIKCTVLVYGSKGAHVRTSDGRCYNTVTDNLPKDFQALLQVSLPSHF